MAENASAESVAADIRPADYRGAVKRIRGVDAKKTKIASINGEIADIWAKVEGLKVHKQAAKWFAKLDKLEPKDRQDILRGLRGLINAAEWPDEADLVDRADGNNVVSLGGKGGDDDDGSGGGGDTGGGGDEDDEDEAAPSGSAAAGLEALSRSRTRLGGGAGEAPLTH